MASPSDLATLAAVKAWLSITNANSDAVLAPLITAASRLIYATTGRGSFLPATFTDRLDGNGSSRLFPSRYPVISVSAVTVCNTAVPAAPTPTPGSTAQQSGYLLRPWDGIPPGSLQPLDVFGYCVPAGRQNIALTYLAGYQVSAEPATVPSSPDKVTTIQPYGPWATDAGVVYAATGVALTKVASAPAAGQYALDATAGIYDFSAADSGANILLSYGFIPQDISQVCIELVSERYSYRSRIGQVSKSLGGQETITYSQKDMSDAQRLMLQPYRRVTPLW